MSDSAHSVIQPAKKRKDGSETLSPSIFHFLHHSKQEKNKLPAEQIKEPLLYYMRSYFYNVVHCSHNTKDKEDWISGFHYWEEIADYVTKTKEWHQNGGLDHFTSASHPKSGPHTLDPHTINEFSRQTFLRTDFDVVGYIPKDVIVPYYVRPAADLENDPIVSPFTRVSPTVSYADMKHTLLVFIGSDNPVNGLRSRIMTQLRSLKRDDIHITFDKVTVEKYREKMLHSEFCLSLRGDTASSSRLFAIIDSGCIPVIISDWLLLPFESIVDYSTFTIRFPESVEHNISQLVQYLDNISFDDRKIMSDNIQKVRTMLLFEVRSKQTVSDTSIPNSYSSLSLLNPVTLTLIELFQRKESYCKTLTRSFNSNKMCLKIEQRLQYASSHLFSLSQLN
jgi:hypothetical protein